MAVEDAAARELTANETGKEKRRMRQPRPNSNSNSNPDSNFISNSSSTGANDAAAASRVNSVVVNVDDVASGDVKSVRVVNGDHDDGISEARENNDVCLNEQGSAEGGRRKVVLDSKEVVRADMWTHNINAWLDHLLCQPLKSFVFVLKFVISRFSRLLSGDSINHFPLRIEAKPARSKTKVEEVLPTLNADDDGSLPFFMIDAYEEELHEENRGNLYLFGKVKAGNLYHSCCVVVKNMQRCVYAIPSDPKKLQDATNEISKHLLDLKVSKFSMAHVKRKYAYEPYENDVVQINYPFKDPVLPVGLKGESFSALLGTHCSAAELFLIQREIKKGPSWLQVSNFSTSSNSQRVSWCKFEVTVDCPDDIRIPKSSEINFEIPPVVVTVIKLKTIINEKENVNEIISASIVSCDMVKIGTPMLASGWKRDGMLIHFTVIRKLDGDIFPPGFRRKVKDRNLEKAGSKFVCVESSERELLKRLMTQLQKLDTDVLVGHNISGFDLDVLLHRTQACKVRSNTWSKLGRLKHSALPKLNRGNSTFGFGAHPVIMSCIAGRLLCDTYLWSRDLLKEVSYSLTELAKTQLNKFRKEVAPHDVPKMFQSAKSLIELIKHGEMEARLSMALMFHLNVLPLTYQLTSICGGLWGQTLQSARAQRAEYLLLHAFHAKSYIVPDKIPNLAKETKLRKHKVTHGVEDSNSDEEDVDGTNYDNDAPDSDHKKNKNAPSYAGGLVLEPKKGLYDKYVLLLDFNCLYPSIIQEYNICFTTVERSSDGSFETTGKTTGVLPALLKYLVEWRKAVKSKMKTASGLEVYQLDILQQALKLTASSIYGCLGFSNSRFYAKPLAELITQLAGEVLQSTVDLVKKNLNLEVIYGDIDSIMIYSGLDDIAKAKSMADKVILEVNKKYRCFEIDLDALYKRMLLLEKEKYAAVKVTFKGAASYEVTERKGLVILPRDRSKLAKELGEFCLSLILSRGSREDVVESIHSSLMKVQEEMRSGQVPLDKYVITKTLTKSPDAYPDAKNQPHVLVAQRLKQQGYLSGCSVGDTVSYIICCEEGSSSGSATDIAQRARHLDELKREQGKWQIDIDYYLSQQIHPVVSRLCVSIQGTSPERLADCLGLDSSKFQCKSSQASSSDPTNSLFFAANDEERYQGCKPLVLSCPKCSYTFDYPAVFKSICLLGSEKTNSSEKIRDRCGYGGVEKPRRMGTSSAMDQYDECMNKQIASLSWVMSLVQSLNEDDAPCKIDGGLFLGSVGTAVNKDALKSLNITHILTVAGKLPPAHPGDFVYKIIEVLDNKYFNLKQYFDECFEFIDEARRHGGGRVLVHCVAGRSRSVTVIVAYLMKTRGMSLSEALQHVKSTRPQASPNSGFIRQLEDFEKSLQVAN